jgi:hypothetical protein
MGTDEFHYRLGKYVYERELQLGIHETSMLSAAYQYGVPVFTSSPGDSSIGMNVAAMSMRGREACRNITLQAHKMHPRHKRGRKFQRAFRSAFTSKADQLLHEHDRYLLIPSYRP